MKIFDRVNPWPTKVNFVDDKNVVLGYDMENSCCESFGWFIANKPATKFTQSVVNQLTKRKNYVGWNFDVNYFKEIRGENSSGDSHDVIAIFRIVRGKQQKFIHIHNSHNGYYGHGFNFEVGGKKIKKGCL